MERVELHIHTKMSQMDGITSCEDYIKKAKECGMIALAITDHGNVQAFPKVQDYLERNNDSNFKVIYGMEGYLLPSNNINEKTYHITILVKNKTGLKNLYKIVSISHLDYFYKKPCILKSLLEKYRKGLLLGSSCEKGELYQAILSRKTTEEIEKIAKFYDYLEIQPIENNAFLIRNESVKDKEALRNINRKIVALGEKIKKTVIATGDVHFLNKKDEIYRRILQTSQGYLEGENQPPLYFRTTEEMLEEFSYLGKEKAYEIVVTNTNKIANMCDKIIPIPKGKYYPHLQKSEVKIKKLAYEGAYKLFGTPLPVRVQERLDKELSSIIEYDFSTIYLITEKLVKKSNEDGYIVGNRGSVGSSLVAYCLGITKIDPIKHNIPFEVFAGIDGNREPDIDLNFARGYQLKIQKYVEDIFGKDRVYNPGTIGTMAENVAYFYVKNYFKERKIEVGDSKIKKLAQGLLGVKRTTGKHPGGLIIIPKEKEIYDFCPIQHLANDSKSNIITTHFDYLALYYTLLKLDILEHDVPNILHRLQELTNVDLKTISLDDKKTLKMICSADTLAIPEFESDFVRNIIKETKPSNFEDLVKISGLSHGTNVWIGNVQDLIKSGVITLKDAIAFRDDIMNYLISKGIERKIAFYIMESVRKGKVRKNKEPNWEKYKEIMKDYNVPDWFISSCEKISYLFPKAHSTDYVMNSFMIAWFKVHYPKEFYKTYFELESDIDISLLNTKEQVLEKLQELEERLRIKSKDGYYHGPLLYEITDCKVALEMYNRGIKFSDI